MGVGLGRGDGTLLPPKKSRWPGAKGLDLRPVSGALFLSMAWSKACNLVGAKAG